MSVAVANTNGATTSPRREAESTTDEPEVDPHFEPVVVLPEVEVSTNEENEEELIKVRAKLFRFDTSDPGHPEWKERGTGEVKLLRHKENHSVRVVMRRDKTLKICANHFITPWMELKPSCGSNRAWVWTVPADFADETAKAECLAIRFASHEIAAQWKTKFEEAKKIIREECELYKNTSSTTLEDSSDEDEITNDGDEITNDGEITKDGEMANDGEMAKEVERTKDGEMAKEGEITNDEDKENQSGTNEQNSTRKDDVEDEKVISKMAELNVTK